MVEFLLEQGADVSLLNKDNRIDAILVGQLM